MKKVILTNGDFELTIVKGDVFRHHSHDQEVVYVISESNLLDGTVKCGIVYDYLLESYLTDFVVSSLSE